MAVWEGKKYKMEKSENFDEYMKALGEFNSYICCNKPHLHSTSGSFALRRLSNRTISFESIIH